MPQQQFKLKRVTNFPNLKWRTKELSIFGIMLLSFPFSQYLMHVHPPIQFFVTTAYDTAYQPASSVHLYTVNNAACLVVVVSNKNRDISRAILLFYEISHLLPNASSCTYIHSHPTLFLADAVEKKNSPHQPIKNRHAAMSELGTWNVAEERRKNLEFFEYSI